jgi:hypothetical protein
MRWRGARARTCAGPAVRSVVQMTATAAVPSLELESAHLARAAALGSGMGYGGSPLPSVRNRATPLPFSNLSERQFPGRTAHAAGTFADR